MEEVLRQTIAEGFTVFKFKVGSSIEADRERLAAVRKVLGYDNGYTVMIDANQVSSFSAAAAARLWAACLSYFRQVWSVPEAIEYMKHLVEFKPVFIEG